MEQKSLEDMLLEAYANSDRGIERENRMQKEVLEKLIEKADQKNLSDV